MLALTDHDGMYGVPQFAQAAARLRDQGTKLGTVFGAELSLGLPGSQSGVPDPEGRHLLVLARDPEGYRRLCAAISAAQLAGGEKGRPVYDVAALAGAHDGHWVVLTGCRKGQVPAALAAGGPEAAWRELATLTRMFGHENVMVELTCQHDPGDDERNDMLARLAALADLGVVADRQRPLRGARAGPARPGAGRDPGPAQPGRHGRLAARGGHRLPAFRRRRWPRGCGATRASWSGPSSWAASARSTSA